MSKGKLLFNYQLTGKYFILVFYTHHINTFFPALGVYSCTAAF